MQIPSSSNRPTTPIIHTHTLPPPPPVTGATKGFGSLRMSLGWKYSFCIISPTDYHAGVSQYTLNMSYLRDLTPINCKQNEGRKIHYIRVSGEITNGNLVSLSIFQGQSWGLTDKFFELMPGSVTAPPPVLKPAFLAGAFSLFELSVSFGKAVPHYTNLSKDL